MMREGVGNGRLVMSRCDELFYPFLVWAWHFLRFFSVVQDTLLHCLLRGLDRYCFSFLHCLEGYTFE